MTKNVSNSATINQAVVAAKATLTASTEKQPVIFYPIEDEGTRKYYESLGTTIKTIKLGGKKRVFAIIPAKDEAEAKNMNRILGAMMKKEERHAIQQALREFSLDGLIDAGYDPSLDIIDIPININDSDLEANEVYNGIDPGPTTKITLDATITITENTSDSTEGYYKPTTASRGAYAPYEDEHNPCYILQKKILFEKLASLVDGLNSDERVIVNMILEDKTDRAKAAELDIAQTTLSSRKIALFKKLYKKLKSYK